MITQNQWKNYVQKLSQLSKEAGKKIQEYVDKYGFDDRNALIAYADALVQKYGSGASELACQMYEATAEMEGKLIDSALPAEVASTDEIGKAINGSLKQSPTGALIQSTTERLVKQAGADTTLQNAVRDGAYFAWIPSGDSCSFCVMLASNGWQRQGKKARQGIHAEHIHANCDCQYCVSFNSKGSLSDYNPSVYRGMYYAESGKPKDKLNAMRRKAYQENKDQINAQKRAAYAKRKQGAE